MKKDAEDLEKDRLEKVTKYNEEEKVERAQAVSKDNTKHDPKFISSMGQDVFSGGSTATIEDRVRRNRYYIQKRNLDERGIFS